MFGFIERVVIPTVVIFVMVGGLAGMLLGLLLVVRSDATLRFVRRMNRWVSTREALRPLDAPHMMEAPTPRLRRWLGAFLVFGGGFAVVYLLIRFNIDRGPYVPSVDLRRWVLSGIALEWTKWFLVAGTAFSCVVGVLMVFFPQRLAAFEASMDRWYSSAGLLAADERMHTVLEPRVEANPRAAGALIAAASLLVVVAMIILIAAKLR
jgi:hypothetical protein